MCIRDRFDRHRGRRRHQALPGRARADRRPPVHPRGGDPRVARPQWGGKVHSHPRTVRSGASRRGHRYGRGRNARRWRRPPGRWARHQHRAPGTEPRRRAQCRREPLPRPLAAPRGRGRLRHDAGGCRRGVRAARPRHRPRRIRGLALAGHPAAGRDLPRGARTVPPAHPRRTHQRTRRRRGRRGAGYRHSYRL